MELARPVRDAYSTTPRDVHHDKRWRLLLEYTVPLDSVTLPVDQSLKRKRRRTANDFACASDFNIRRQMREMALSNQAINWRTTWKARNVSWAEKCVNRLAGEFVFFFTKSVRLVPWSVFVKCCEQSDWKN